MSKPEPILGSCLAAIFWIGIAIYFGLCWFPYLTTRDNVMSACPRAGVATVDDVLSLTGATYTVRCLDGSIVRLDHKGRPES